MADRPAPTVDTAALLSTIVQSTEDAIVSTDLNGTFTSWNPAAERIYGYTASEVIGHPIRLIIPLDRFGEEDDVVRRVLDGQFVPTFETVRIRKDGTRINVSLTTSAIRRPDDSIVGISKISRDVSGRLRSEQQFREVLDRMSDAFCTVDRDWHFTYVNERYARLAGVRREDLLGKIVWEVFPEATRIKVFAAAQRAMHDNQPTTLEDYYPPLDLWFETRLYPTADGVASFTTDITEQKRVDRNRDDALAVSHRLASIVESSDDAIIGKDLEGLITSWNPAAERLFGYTVAEAVGRSIRIIIPEERQDEETAVLDQIRRGEKIEHFETIRCHQNGTCLPISLTVSPIRNHVGVVIGASKTARDISERKRAEEETDREHRRTVFLAQVAAALSTSLDYEQTLKGIAILAVPSIADWCAVDVLRDDGEIARLAVAHVDPAKIDLAKDVVRYEDPTAPYSITHAMRTGTPVMISEITDEMIVAAAHGDQERLGLVRSLGLTSYLCVPLLSGGRALGALTLAIADSGRRYTDDDRRLAEDIASRAALAVENARSYEQLKRANLLKDEFLATLSHELRTPLNAILGYARMVRAGMITGDKLTRALETIERNSTALTQMVEDILDVSRIVSGRMRLNVQPVELSLVVHEAVETITPAADAKRIRIHTLIDPQVGAISGDPDRLREIVSNLLSNAVKFTPKEGRVQLRLERVNSSVEIIVSDTGIGIPADFLPQMFERFRQADSGTTRQHAGLGLGLAIVRNLVEMHGGAVYASSGGPGTGATFRVRLPVMIVHPEASQEKRVHPRHEPSPPAARLPDLSGIHVFAVDDEPDALRLLTEILEAAGARVTTATSAAAGLEKIHAATPHVLVADLGMPLMDGFELIRELRQSTDERVRDIPAAALTAYARSEDRARTLQAGFEMHLSKPIDPVELVSSVKALARRRSGPH